MIQYYKEKKTLNNVLRAVKILLLNIHTINSTLIVIKEAWHRVYYKIVVENVSAM